MVRDLTPDDLHGFVLQRAFRTMTSHPEMINIRADNNKVVAFNRDVLILFSNFVRSILSDLPCCSSNVTPVILLPSVSTSVLIKLQDILHQGHCDETLDLHETSQLLDAAASLGLDIKKFYIGKEKKGAAVKEALVNLDNVKSNSKEIKSIIEQKQREGSQVVLMKTSKSRANMSTSAKTSLSASSMIPPSTPISHSSPRPTAEPTNSSQPSPAVSSGPRANDVSEDFSINPRPVVKTAPPSASKSSSAAAKSSSSSSSMVSPLTMPVKQERREEEVASAKTSNPPPEPMEEDQPSAPRQQALSTTAPTPQQQSTAPATTAASSVTDPPPALEYKCEVKNCNKPFSTVILLKYHYCSHFMSMLKRNHEHLLDNSNSCKDCKKNFQNSRRLLLHIGVNHDKINEILRSRGYKELPPHSASMLQQAVATKAAEKAAAASAAAEKEKGVFDVRKILDVKNVPLIPTPRRTSETDTGTKESSSSQSSSVASSSGSSVSPSESSQTASLAPPGPPASSDSTEASLSAKTAQDKDKTEANCNYELECQVSYEKKH